MAEQLCASEVKSCSTPGLDSLDDKDGEHGEDLEPADQKRYRAIAARCMYLSMDRPEIMFAVKECCREMSRPTSSSWRRLVRVGQFLQAHPRAVWKFRWQGRIEVLDVYGDSNWAS